MSEKTDRSEQAILQRWNSEIDGVKLDDDFLGQSRRGRYRQIFAKLVEEAVPLVKVTQVLISANEEAEKALRERKKELVIARALAHLNQRALTLDRLSNFLENPYGSLLFHKILRIAAESPPVEHCLQALSAALLKCMADGRVEQLFRTHKMALDLLEQMTPQDIFILQDWMRWPTFSSPFGSMNGQPTGDWFSLFGAAYVESRRIADPEARRNFELALKHLHDRHFVEAYGGGGEPIRVVPTGLAHLVIPYIT